MPSPKLSTGGLPTGRENIIVVDGLCLTIRDQGKGFSWDGKAPAGMGLRIMGYRTDNLGGVLSVQSELNAGTEIKCIFPNGFP